MSGTRKLKWPDGRGEFVDADPDRARKAGERDGRGKFRASPGTVIEVDDADVADHYIDRGWQPADEDDDVTEDEAEPMAYEDFAAMGYEARTEAVEAGDADHILDQIEDDDDSQNVQDAVEDRREEIGG